MTHTDAAFRPLLIGVDARAMHHPNSGIGRYTAALCREWADGGHRLQMYSDAPLPTAWADALTDEARARIAQRAWLAEPRGRLASNLAVQVAYPRWARQDDIDVLFAPRHHLPLYWPRTLKHVPRVIALHDLIWRELPATMPTLSRWLEALLTGPSASRADRIVTASQSTQDALHRWRSDLSHKARPIPQGPTIGPTDPQADHGPVLAGRSLPYALYVGTLEPRKNLGNLLSGWALAKQRGLAHTLVLAGSPAGLEGLTELIAASGLTDQDVVHCADPSDALLASLYANCAFLALPSWYEGFGLPVVEALGFDKPVLVSNGTSLAEIGGEAAVLVNPGDAGDIADGLVMLGADAELQQTLAEAARHRARGYCWRQTADATTDVLQAAIADRGGPQS